MNVWNVRSATSVSKPSALKFALFAAAIFVPCHVQAQGSAPGMYGVGEVVIEYPRFANPKAADACSLTREDMSNLLAKTLVEDGVPALPVATAKPPMMGVARIQLVPEVSTLNLETLDCVSWVSLSAETQNNVVVSPVPTPRNVRVVYWHKGSMTASGQSTHADIVGDVLKKMAAEFAQQYRVDQPPKLPQ